jgi:hypothetical protein
MRMAAFCGPTCFGKYYAARCRVCDKAIKADKLKPGRNAVQFCGRGHRLEYQRERLRYQFLRAQNPSKQGDMANCPKIADLPLENPYKTGVFSGDILPLDPHYQPPVDHSDVEALRIRLLRRDGWLDTPQMSMCRKLDRQIARGGLPWHEFNRLSRIIAGMKSALPRSMREAERALASGLPLPVPDAPVPADNVSWLEPAGPVVEIYLQDEAPAIGSGWRRVQVLSIDDVEVKVRAAASSAPAEMRCKIERAVWDRITRASAARERLSPRRPVFTEAECAAGRGCGVYVGNAKRVCGKPPQDSPL